MRTRFPGCKEGVEGLERRQMGVLLRLWESLPVLWILPGDPGGWGEAPHRERASLTQGWAVHMNLL